jgi:hypothetical protein
VTAIKACTGCLRHPRADCGATRRPAADYRAATGDLQELASFTVRARQPRRGALPPSNIGLLGAGGAENRNGTGRASRQLQDKVGGVAPARSRSGLAIGGVRSPNLQFLHSDFKKAAWAILAHSAAPSSGRTCGAPFLGIGDRAGPQPDAGNAARRRSDDDHHGRPKRHSGQISSWGLLASPGGGR